MSLKPTDPCVLAWGHAATPASYERRNPGAGVFGLGAPLVQGWRHPGCPLVHGHFHLVQGGSGLGSLRGERWGNRCAIAPPSVFGGCAEMCSNRSVLAAGGYRGVLRLDAIASNGRVLRTRPCLVPHGSPGGSLRAGGAFAALRAAQPQQRGRR